MGGDRGGMGVSGPAGGSTALPLPACKGPLQQQMHGVQQHAAARALRRAAALSRGRRAGGLRGGAAASPRPSACPPPLRPPHLVCGESASSTLSLGPWPLFRVTSCRFSIASAAEEARSNLT